MLGQNVDREVGAGQKMAENGIAQIDADKYQRGIE